jgi:hypothetical protein
VVDDLFVAVASLEAADDVRALLARGDRSGWIRSDSVMFRQPMP